MIISPSRKFLFVHIPKTGGTSFSQAYEARSRPDDILIGDTAKAKKRRHRLDRTGAPGRVWKHSTLADIEGMAGVGDLDSYFICTMVRDPWDRVFSLYHWLRAQSFDHFAVGIAKQTEFNEFLGDKDVMKMLSRDAANTYVTDRQGKLVCNAFIRLEHLESDLKPVWDWLAIDLSPLPKVNASGRPIDSRAAYDPQMVTRVGRWFAQDIEQFDYRF